MSLVQIPGSNKTAQLVMLADGSLDLEANVVIEIPDVPVTKVLTLTTDSAVDAYVWASGKGRSFSIKPEGGGLYVRINGTADGTSNDMELADGEGWNENIKYTSISIKRKSAVSTKVKLFAGGVS